MKNINIICCLLCLVVGLVGCRSMTPDVEDLDPITGSLREAKTIHLSLVSQQINKDYKLWRCDHREPWYAEVGEAIYLYPIPYVPYFLLNVPVVTLTEIARLPYYAVVGGSRHQDEAQLSTQEILKDYETFFYKAWGTPRQYADFVNMDEYEYSPSYLVK
ncbi:MAG TPA: hypothetical protein P5543_08835 [Planctomycetota bacterium]|nr:hypothetical protein [Planctomycetota bacterium]